MPRLNIDRCPDCGCDEFGVSAWISGKAVIYYKFNGDETDNNTMHDHLNYKETVTAYCQQCQKKLGRVID